METIDLDDEDAEDEAKGSRRWRRCRNAVETPAKTQSEDDDAAEDADAERMRTMSRAKTMTSRGRRRRKADSATKDEASNRCR